ncbi:hypothetical protein C1J00_07740 [Streptomyces cahuitamycinicus]|uniref:Uncharacterized protein n=1 Tax=Streptomyces cahuitamycinicus TaxID=2070367 RepID=A0A2N8TUP7_9ACTN|nr:hypothetical protein C1J00_07740 [Streptomyces cahuitamycinicus]
MDAAAERAGLEGALRAVGLCRAHHAAVTFGVGALFGHEHVVRAGADAVDPVCLSIFSAIRSSASTIMAAVWATSAQIIMVRRATLADSAPAASRAINASFSSGEAF